MPEHNEGANTITRTYRAAIRLGEDFVTLEETIRLPLDATDDDIQQAVALGWRIYQAQHESLQGQVAALRETQPSPASAPITIRNPEAPASDRQRSLIASLQHDIHWDNQQLASYAGERGIDLVEMTKGQASSFIDELKRLSETRASYGRAESEEPAASNEPGTISERQRQALAKLAQERGIDAEDEVQQTYGVPLTDLSNQQASELIRAWQPPRGRGKAAPDQP
jgi:hypothetical protein